jgi:hypothetical protein
MSEIRTPKTLMNSFLLQRVAVGKFCSIPKEVRHV